MKIYLWQSHCRWLDQLILFDGENIYLADEMRPSCGYSESRMNGKPCPLTGSTFTYIG